MAELALSMNQVDFAWPKSAPLFRDFDFQLPKGSITAVVGASGCGKSTLLHLAAGLHEPQNGTIQRANGRLGMVFQSPSLLPWRTCLDNVALPLELEGDPNAKEKAKQALAMVGLSNAKDKRPDALSGGMQMRTALARALATEPSMLFLDEAFSALDAITRKEIHQEFRKLHEQLGFTVLLVTHDIEEALLLANKVEVLRGQPAALTASFALPATELSRHDWKHSPAFGSLLGDIEAAL